MKKLLNILVLAAVAAAAVSCAYERQSFSFQDAKAIVSDFPMLSAVPQDAPAVFCLNACAQGLEQVYAKAPFDSLDFGAFADQKALLSFFQDGKLKPCLYLDLAAADEASVASLIGEMEGKGLKAKILEMEGRKLLFVTNSDYALANQEFSMASGKSVLDAPGFSEALASAPLAKGVTMFFNNKEAAKMPGKVLAGEVNKTKLASFLSVAAAWTVISDEDGTLYDVAPLTFGDGFYFMDVFASLRPGESCVGEILPKHTTFLVDLPVASWKQLRSRYVAWLKARSGNPVKAETDPLTWAKMVNPKEFAFIHFNKFRVVAVRAGSHFKEHAPAVNPYPGAVAALAGNAFKLNDDSVFAVSGKWIIIGSEEAVKFFFETGKTESLPVFCGKTVNYGIFKTGEALWDEGGLIRLQFAK